MIDHSDDSSAAPVLREGVDRAIVRARREVILRHRRLDLPLAVWRDDQVVLVSPHDVPLPGSPPDDASASR